MVMPTCCRSIQIVPELLYCIFDHKFRHMGQHFFRLRLFFSYLLRAKHRKGHGIHSPFVYEFVIRVLYDQEGFEGSEVFEDTRKELLRSEEEIGVQEIGAGSGSFSSATRKVRDMVRHSSVQPKFGGLLYRIARTYRPAATHFSSPASAAAIAS